MVDHQSPKSVFSKMKTPKLFSSLPTMPMPLHVPGRSSSLFKTATVPPQQQDTDSGAETETEIETEAPSSPTIGKSSFPDFITWPVPVARWSPPKPRTFIQGDEEREEGEEPFPDFPDPSVNLIIERTNLLERLDRRCAKQWRARQRPARQPSLSKGKARNGEDKEGGTGLGGSARVSRSSAAFTAILSRIDPYTSHIKHSDDDPARAVKPQSQSQSQSQPLTSEAVRQRRRNLMQLKPPPRQPKQRLQSMLRTRVNKGIGMALACEKLVGFDILIPGSTNTIDVDVDSDIDIDTDADTDADSGRVRREVVKMLMMLRETFPNHYYQKVGAPLPPCIVGGGSAVPAMPEKVWEKKAAELKKFLDEHTEPWSSQSQSQSPSQPLLRPDNFERSLAAGGKGVRGSMSRRPPPPPPPAAGPGRKTMNIDTAHHGSRRGMHDARRDLATTWSGVFSKRESQIDDDAPISTSSSSIDTDSGDTLRHSSRSSRRHGRLFGMRGDGAFPASSFIIKDDKEAEEDKNENEIESYAPLSRSTSSSCSSSSSSLHTHEITTANIMHFLRPSSPPRLVHSSTAKERRNKLRKRRAVIVEPATAMAAPGSLSSLKTIPSPSSSLGVTEVTDDPTEVEDGDGGVLRRYGRAPSSAESQSQSQSQRALYHTYAHAHAFGGYISRSRAHTDTPAPARPQHDQVDRRARQVRQMPSMSQLLRTLKGKVTAAVGEW